ncbi:hypothetical protein ACFLWU_07075, partial [Chloroflexota bacterium]
MKLFGKKQKRTKTHTRVSPTTTIAIDANIHDALVVYARSKNKFLLDVANERLTYALMQAYDLSREEFLEK